VQVLLKKIKNKIKKTEAPHGRLSDNKLNESNRITIKVGMGGGDPSLRMTVGMRRIVAEVAIRVIGCII
jgi:hypothetical protein